MNLLVMAAFGAAGGIGALLAVAGLRGRRVLPIGRRSTGPARFAPVDRILVRATAAVGLAILGVTATSWPVVGGIGALVGWLAPSAFAVAGRHGREVAKVEAIAAWAEQLRDTLSAANGLEHAIGASRRVAPVAIAPAVERLSARVEYESLPVALRGFADDVDHPLADFVVAALVIAAEKEARELSSLLGHLAECARDEARMRTRVWVSRARTRTAVRVIGAVVVLFVAGLLVLDRAYLAPYDSATGQLVLLVIAAIFAASFAGMERMARITLPERFVGRRSEVVS